MNENFDMDFCDCDITDKKTANKEKIKKILNTIKGKCKDISDITLCEDYESTIKVCVKGDEESPKMKTTIKGTMRVNLLKVVAILGIITIFICMTASVCRLFRK